MGAFLPRACASCAQAASVFTTAIVTGRSKDKVYNFVGLDDVFYAGSHGLEIQGPSEKPVKCQVTKKQTKSRLQQRSLPKCFVPQTNIVQVA